MKKSNKKYVDECEHEWKLKDQFTIFSICCECEICGCEWFFNYVGEENGF